MLDDEFAPAIPNARETVSGGACLTRVAADPPSRFLHRSSGDDSPGGPLNFTLGATRNREEVKFSKRHGPKRYER